MGMKDGKVGAFPSNFVKEIFVLPKGWRPLSFTRSWSWILRRICSTYSCSRGSHFLFLPDGKHGEGKVRPRLADAVFNREVHTASLIFIFFENIYLCHNYLKIFCGFFFFSLLGKEFPKGKCEKKSKKWWVCSLLLWKLFPFLCIFSI